MKFKYLSILMVPMALSFVLKGMEQAGSSDNDFESYSTANRQREANAMNQFVQDSNDNEDLEENFDNQISNHHQNEAEFSPHMSATQAIAYEGNRDIKNKKNCRPRHSKKLRRTYSFSDIKSLRNDHESTQPIDALAPLINNHASSSNSATKENALQYLKDHLNQEEVEKISSALKGKTKNQDDAKPNEEIMQPDKPGKGKLSIFKVAEQAEEEKREKNSMGIANVMKTLEEIGDGPIGRKVANLFVDSLTSNRDAYNEREKILATAKAAATKSLALHEQKLEKTRIHADANRAAHVEAQIKTAGINSQKWINLIKHHPYLLVLLGSGLSGGFFAAKHGMKVLFNEVERIIGIPKLAQSTSLLTIRETMAKWLGLYKDEVLNPQDVIFNKEFKSRMDRLTASIRNTVNNDDYFRNLLFYGAPGTGKTLIAKTIAKNCGLHYIYFAASGLSKLHEKDALNQVAELFEFAKRSPKKLMIIIDEAEVLFADRSNPESGSLMKKILNLILSYTGTESKDYFLTVLTNRPEDLDQAFISRCGEKIEFPAPSHEEIKAMLTLYINKLLRIQPVAKATLYEKWFGKKTPAKRIFIEPGALNLQGVDSIAKKIQGFVGRDISQLIIAIKAEAYTTNILHITKKLIDDIVDRKVKEKNQSNQKFLK